jgi:adenylosuccinate lyase
MLTLNLCRLGLAIPEEAIEQMKACVEVTDEDLNFVAKEEKIRRHDVMGSSSNCLRVVRHVFTLKTCLLASNYVLLLLKLS